jgi:hypothetical protein
MRIENHNSIDSSALAQSGLVRLCRLPELRAPSSAIGQAALSHSKASKAASVALLVAATLFCGCGKAKQATPPSPTVAVTWQGLTTDYKGQTLVED